ncbi:MAG TPA: hypothetical protein VKA05_01255, partial [Acidimicrobiales bacterium]|nr:hypothetical protein [Acidimicrobiales bacterium]
SPFTTIASGDPYQLYAVSTTEVLAELDLIPFGIRLEPVDFRVKDFGYRGGTYAVQSMLELFIVANASSFGERALEMPRWVMVDLALLPSAMVLALASRNHVAQLAETQPNASALTKLLSLATDLAYEGPLPVAGYAAAPTPTRGRWVGWSVWSLVSGQNLGYALKRLALASYRANRQVGVTQFDNLEALYLHPKFGKLRITCAKLTAHPSPHTFSYEVDLRFLPNDGSPADPAQMPASNGQIVLDDDLDGQLTAVQAAIEHGEEYYVLPLSKSDVDARTIPTYHC